MKLSTTKGEWKSLNFNMEEVICSSTNNELATVHCVWNSEEGVYETKGNASVMAAAPELLEQVKSLSYCFGELLNHSESIPTRLGWDHEKLEEWKKELDELVIKAEGK